MDRLTVSSPLGALTLCEEEGRLCALLFSDQAACSQSPLLRRAAAQLQEYFAGRRRVFDLPLAVKGSDFRQSVLFALLHQVGYGECVTYSELAALSGYPRACRAVGNCMHTNPLPIFIPCHRVVSKGGLGNYAWGMDCKLFLMRLEGMDV